MVYPPVSEFRETVPELGEKLAAPNFDHCPRCEMGPVKNAVGPRAQPNRLCYKRAVCESPIILKSIGQIKFDSQGVSCYTVSSS